MVVALDEGVEAGLLLEHVGGGGLGRFRFQGQMHAFVPTVLLGMPGRDALDVDAEAQPPDGEFAEAIERVGGSKGDAVVGANGVGEANSLKVPHT
jgi:hypothetical protein